MKRIDWSFFCLAVIIAAVCVSSVFRVSSRSQSEERPQVQLTATPEQVIGNRAAFAGNRSAPLTLVEFADYQCPACIAANSMVKAALADSPTRLRAVFRHFPLAMHRNAYTAAVAAEIARKQDRFWQMHELLMGAAGDLNNANIRAMAARSGVDLSHYEEKIVTASKSIDEDRKAGLVLGVTSTPTWFVCTATGQVYRLGSLRQLDQYLR